jgi:hypothetical protein
VVTGADVMNRSRGAYTVFPDTPRDFRRSKTMDTGWENGPSSLSLLLYETVVEGCDPRDCVS